MTARSSEMESVGEIIGRLANEVKAREAAANETALPRREGLNWSLIVVGGLVAYQVVKLLIWLRDPNVAVLPQTDHSTYMDQAHRILAGGPWYKPFELAGPYTMVDLPELYPPITTALMLPFALLPDVLWWAIPLTITSAIVWHHRPSILGWALILLCLTYPMTEFSIVAGNPAIWMMAFVALGTVYRWPAAFVLLKPTLAPFALIGVRSRGWWVGLGLLVAGTVVLWQPSFDYLAALRNFRGADIPYLFAHVPMMLIPLVAWRDG